ncbi:MAG: type II secretion system protein GspE [Actinobacteria bacterium HGW-Actinobacteria-7]|jgi:type IV pilus assembly protein PilB|nr:MAG: type II secretion system protein GspE [Actinobacteria bacterium HGW-Actinobacteria-7]
MTEATQQRLGRMLVRAGVIDDLQLAEAMSGASGRSLPAVLEELGYATETRVAQALAEQMGLAFIDVGSYDVDPNVAVLVPQELMRKHLVMPIREENGELVVAMADPANIFAIDDLRIVTRKEIRAVVAVESELSIAIDRFTTSQTNVGEMLGDLEDSVRVSEGEDEADLGSNSAVAKLMNQIVTDAIRQGAGDIYIEPGEAEMRIRFRIDGVCQEMFTAPKRMQRQLISRLKITSNMDISERRIPLDGRFGVVLDGKSVDFRVATLPLVHGELAVLRLLRKDSIMMSLRDLGFLEQNMQRLLAALALPYGAILVTGPTGSGKSTTLYAAINETNDPKTNLITVEDPVEYRLSGLSQVHVNEKAGLTFAAALRSILRQDPDKVMIGEIRDKETGTIAIEAALTGHLVLSTLHTNDAPSALTRLTEMGIEPFLSASAITLVVAQRLARRLCSECKEEYTPDETALARVNFPFEPGRPPRLFRARGCKKCNGIGYKGRMGIHEVMSMSETLERLTVESASADEIARQAISEGMLTLREDGFSKVLAGQTSIEEILRVVV